MRFQVPNLRTKSQQFSNLWDFKSVPFHTNLILVDNVITFSTVLTIIQ